MKRLSILTGLLLLLPSLLNLSLADTQIFEPDNRAVWIKTAIDHYVEKQSVPAIAVVLIEQGKVTDVLTSGVTHRHGGQAINKNTVFQIASLSKIFTGILAHNLINEGIILPHHQVLDYMPADLSPKARRNLNGVTIRHLLQHHSGLPRDSQVVTREGNAPMLTPLSESGLLADLDRADMVGAPGGQYEYSNLGYGLLGYVMEQASNKPYARLIQDYIAEPYHLADTGTVLSASQQTRLATPYTKEDGFKPTRIWQTGKLTPASGLFSTPSDLGRLMARQIVAYQNDQDSSLVLTKDLAPVSKGRFYGYGINQMTIEIDSQSKTFLFHSGDMDGFAGTIMWLTDSANGALILTSRGGKWKSEFQSLLFRKIADLPAALPHA